MGRDLEDNDMDYAIAKMIFNQCTEQERTLAMDWMGLHMTEEVIYTLYKEIVKFIERHCAGFSCYELELAWKKYKKLHFIECE